MVVVMVKTNVVMVRAVVMVKERSGKRRRLWKE